MEEENKPKLCELCGKLASIICWECLSYLCDSCSKLIHSIELNNKHKTEKIDPYVLIDIKCKNHPKIPMNLFCVNDKGKNNFIILYIKIINIEVCCSFCHYKKNLPNHKIFEISDPKSIEEENNNLNLYINSFNEKYEETNLLKEKIEDEINKINIFFDKANDEITKLYKKKYENLKKEEEDLKQKLENDVTKIKENLEIFLLQSNEIIKKNETLKKGITILEKEKEINIFKYLNYIEKINKINEGMEKILYTSMKSLKLNLDDINENIEYDEYYFNGIPFPKDIKYNVNNNNFNNFNGFNQNNKQINLSWRIDHNYINIDKNKGLFIVELKKENDIFKEVYKGKDCFWELRNLADNSHYELRICFNYNNVRNYSKEVLKFRTNLYGGGLFGSKPDVVFENN